MSVLYFIYNYGFLNQSLFIVSNSRVCMFHISYIIMFLNQSRVIGFKFSCMSVLYFIYNYGFLNQSLFIVSNSPVCLCYISYIIMVF